MRLKFPENNRILYGQDFALWVGIPPDVEFEVATVFKSRIKLTAPGYGGKPYGNGPIWIYLSSPTKIDEVLEAREDSLLVEAGGERIEVKLETAKEDKQ